MILWQLLSFRRKSEKMTNFANIRSKLFYFWIITFLLLLSLSLSTIFTAIHTDTLTSPEQSLSLSKSVLNFRFHHSLSPLVWNQLAMFCVACLLLIILYRKVIAPFHSIAREASEFSSSPTLIALQEALAQAEISKQRFIAGWMKEVRLTLIQLLKYSDFLKYNGTPKRITQQMYDAVQRLLSITLQEGHTSAIDWQSLFNEILPIYGKEAHIKGMGIDYHIESSLPLFHSDSECIRNILIGLLGFGLRIYHEIHSLNVSISHRYKEGNNHLCYLNICAEYKGLHISHKELEAVMERHFNQNTYCNTIHLADIRHITSALNGELYVNYTYAKGLLLIIELPYSNHEFHLDGPQLSTHAPASSCVSC